MKDYRPYAKRLATLLRDVRVLISPGTPLAIAVSDALVEHPWDKWPDAPKDASEKEDEP